MNTQNYLFNMQFVNSSHCYSPPQPVVCERGMGDDVTKTYPRYVITTDPTIQRQVLCETQTDGGGWTVIQVSRYKDITITKLTILETRKRLPRHSAGPKPMMSP